MPIRHAVAPAVLAIMLAPFVACGGKPRTDPRPGTPATAAGAAARAPAHPLAPSASAAAAGAAAAAGKAATPGRRATADPPATRVTAASGGGPDPCALVTQAEAEAVLGGASTGPSMLHTALLSQCRYAPAAPGGAAGDAVTVQVFPGDGARTWPLRRDTFKQTDPTAQSVTAVGDEALWVGDQRALFVLRHGVVFAVRVPTSGSAAAALDSAKSLAQEAIIRVP
ncbi:MAG TPA: hypothetical protein VKV26_11870 [Dehalococcoidia bacterium]|nr:hypothetical protein [Dehalococcoidia bacterium]